MGTLNLSLLFNALGRAIAQLIPHLYPNNRDHSSISGLLHYTNSGIISLHNVTGTIFEDPPCPTSDRGCGKC
jgi:dTDP-4-dehydrorhamnose reductase